jgi:transposase
LVVTLCERSFDSSMSTVETIDYKKLFEQAQATIREAQGQIAYLNHELERLKKLIFGSRQERFIPAPAAAGVTQGTLALSDEVITELKVTPETIIIRQLAKVEIVTQRKEHPSRILPAHLRREVIVLEPGKDVTGLRRLGFEVTEVLEYLPGELFVKQYLRPIYVLPTPMAETVFIIASLPGRVMEKCMAGEGLLAQMAVDKYLDHIPIHRQLQRFERVGVTVSQSTSNDWMRNLANSMGSLYELHKKQVLNAHYLHVDETTIKVQDETKKGKTHLGYYWVYHNSENKLVLFDYRTGRGREGPNDILKNFTGYLQTDGYGVYDEFDKRPGITLMHCMAHARRKFSEALDSDPVRAGYILEQMKALYAIERRIKEEAMAPDQLLALRQSDAVPLLTAIKAWMLAELPNVLPKSPIGQAIAYSLSRWDKLSLYTSDAKLQIDNNPVERAIRPVAIGYAK